jgi:hypothetical protein
MPTCVEYFTGINPRFRAISNAQTLNRPMLLNVDSFHSFASSWLYWF